MCTKKKLCNIKGISEAKVDKIKEVAVKVSGVIYFEIMFQIRNAKYHTSIKLHICTYPNKCIHCTQFLAASDTESDMSRAKVRVYNVSSFFVFKFAITNSFFVFINEVRKTKTFFVFKFRKLWPHCHFG